LAVAPHGQAEVNQYQESAQEIIADEDFAIHHRTVKVPKEETSSGGNFSWPDWLSNLGVPGFIGAVGVAVFWIILTLVVAGIVYLIIRNWHVFSRGSGGRQGGADKPRTEAVMGMDIRPESLPDNIVAAAREAWRNGDSHLALSILYRGSIAWLVNKESLQAAGNATYKSYFSTLTGTWVDVAYGKKDPEDSNMSDLCDQWPFDAVNPGGRRRG